MTFHYPPMLMGHPHEQAEPQQTEPFWHQFPCQPNNDGRSVLPPVFGYVSNRKQDTKQDRMVEVYLGQFMVRRVPYGNLVQFSKVAYDAFDKPRQSNIAHALREAVSVQDMEELVDSFRHLSPGVDSTSGSVSMAPGSTPEVEKNSPASSEPIESNDPSGAIQTQTSQDGTSAMHLFLAFPDLVMDNALNATAYCLDWMVHQADDIENPGVNQLQVPTSKNLPLEKLIDIYSAATRLGMQPHPRLLRHEIMNRLTEQPPTAGVIERVWTLLPHDDKVITRAVTSSTHFWMGDAYSKKANAEIDIYVHLQPALLRKFHEVEWNVHSKGPAGLARFSTDTVRVRAPATGSAGKKKRSTQRPRASARRK